MEKRCVETPSGPPAAGPYSHAVQAGGFVFVSGQVALAPDGSGPKRGSFEEEVRQALSNLKSVLEDAGSSLGNVVKTTVYISDMEKFAEFNRIYQEFFPDFFPARTCIQAARLPRDFQVEIDAVAIVQQRNG